MKGASAAALGLAVWVGVARLRLPRWCTGGWTYMWRALLVWVGEHPLQPIGIAAVGFVALMGLSSPGSLPGSAPVGVDFAGAASGPEGVWAYLGGLLAFLGLTLARLLEPAWYSEIQRQEVRGISLPFSLQPGGRSERPPTEALGPHCGKTVEDPRFDTPPTIS